MHFSGVQRGHLCLALSHRGYRHGLLLEQQYRVTEKQLAMQTNYTQQLNEQVEIRRRFVHDFRHHLRTIHAMAEQTEDKAILQYLDSIEAYITPSSAASPTHSSRPAVDALLAYYETLTRTRQITLTLRFALPDRIPLSDVELCTILGNLLENAVEACDACRNRRSVSSPLRPLSHLCSGA